MKAADNRGVNRYVIGLPKLHMGGWHGTGLAPLSLRWVRYGLERALFGQAAGLDCKFV